MVLEADFGDEDSFAIGCPTLLTERLVLRQPHHDDIDDLAVLANNRRIANMLGRMPHPYGEAEAKAFVDTATGPRAREAIYAITEAKSGALLGCAGLNPVNGALDLGYWIGQPYWGKGFATEAAHALVDLAFRATNISHLTASCRVTNAASRRVIHKCGFQYVGQGMMNSLAAGPVTAERYRLDRKVWIGLRSWTGTQP